MTDKERLDRLERIARLVVWAGLRARRQMRSQDEKIDILIDSQIQNEVRFAALARAQERTEVGLDGLRETVERFINEGRGGRP